MDSRQAVLKKSLTENNRTKNQIKKTVMQLVLNRFQSTHRHTQRYSQIVLNVRLIAWILF